MGEITPATGVEASLLFLGLREESLLRGFGGMIGASFAVDD